MAEGGASRIQLDDIQQTVTCGICLQMFTDPRGLSCSHTYCFVCLEGFQKSTRQKECPVCRAETIPSKHDLEKLPVNRLANDLVKLVHSYEPSAVEEPPQWKPQKETVKSDSSSSDSSDADSSNDDSSLDLESRLQALLSLGGDVDMDFLRVLEAAITNSDSSLSSGTKHAGVVCDCCHKSSFSGARFKCGICDDFDLCDECEQKPRQDTHQTEFSHLFVKLKKPATTRYPSRRVLGEDSGVMGMTMDVTKKDHSLYVSETETMKITCGKCKTAPITGARFKCGVCPDYDLCAECEKTNEEFHDPEHPFLVFRYPSCFHTTIPQLCYQFYK